MNKAEFGNLIEQFQPIFKELSGKNDEKCVLVVATLVDDFLEKSIENRLIPPKNKQDNVLRSMRNFAFKIDLAYRIGLIPLSEANIYHQLRFIRNKCAHDVEDHDFERDHFKSRMINIIEESKELWEVLKSANKRNVNSVEDFVKDVGWRVAFDLFFSLILAHKTVSIGRVYKVSKLYDSASERFKQHMGISGN